MSLFNAFNLRYIKADPSTYLMVYKKGALKREGVGLSFHYYGLTTSLVAIPIASMEVPFMLRETTRDYQEVTVQGAMIYRVEKPVKLASSMNFTLDAAGRNYISKDPEKLSNRVVNLVQVMVRDEIHALDLRDALASTEQIGTHLKERLRQAEMMDELGLKLVDLTLQAVKPSPETARALEAAVRERLLQEADEALHQRRNSAIEQERAIKENELRTEIAIEAKRQEIQEAQVEAQRSIKERERRISLEEMEGQVVLEARNQELIALSTANARQEADAKAYGMKAILQAMQGMDPRVLEAITMAHLTPDQLVGQAFKSLADHAERIGEFNIAPDMLRELKGIRP
jgi:regulator of protease activity HflC (stomatin/prohibitin superfamily)